MLSVLRTLFRKRAEVESTPDADHPPRGPIPGIDRVDSMDGKAFECYLGVLFRQLGYSVDTTPHHDRGANLIVTRDGVRTAVQAKRGIGHVGVEAVHAVLASMRQYGCARAIVVTNSGCARPAVQLARENDVELWDRRKLQSILGSLRAPDEQPRVPPAQPASAVCARCGEPVSENATRYCLSRPARFGGRVYCSQHRHRAGSAGARGKSSRPARRPDTAGRAADARIR